MMQDISDLVMRIAKIKRERELVRNSLVDAATKAKLLEQLDAAERALSFKTTPEPAKGK